MSTRTPCSSRRDHRPRCPRSPRRRRTLRRLLPPKPTRRRKDAWGNRSSPSGHVCAFRSILPVTVRPHIESKPQPNRDDEDLRPSGRAIARILRPRRMPPGNRARRRGPDAPRRWRDRGSACPRRFLDPLRPMGSDSGRGRPESEGCRGRSRHRSRAVSAFLGKIDGSGKIP